MGTNLFWVVPRQLTNLYPLLIATLIQGFQINRDESIGHFGNLLNGMSSIGGLGSLFLKSLMHCLAERPPKNKKIFLNYF
jgi:hypothetical protein